MPVESPPGASLAYRIKFHVPETVRPVVRNGLLTYYPDATGCIFLTTPAGLLLPHHLPLVPAEVTFCRKVIGFWMAHQVPARLPIAS